jgi:WD40-like Beta Propeller Repeat
VNTTPGCDNSATQFGYDAGTPAAPADGWSATGFGGAINRQQTVVALAMDDAADWSPSGVHDAAIDLLPVVNGTVDAAHERRIMLQNAGGAAATTPNDTVSAGSMISPSFSPDGTKIAFATNSGVWEYTLPANLGSIANGPVQACGGTARLPIPGGSFPFWSPAAVQSAPVSPTNPTNPTNPQPTHSSNVVSKVALTQGHLAQIAKGMNLSLRCSRALLGRRRKDRDRHPQAAREPRQEAEEAEFAGANRGGKAIRRLGVGPPDDPSPLRALPAPGG